MIFVALDASVFNRRMARYVDELGFAAADVVKTQSRLLLKQIIKFTPPDNLAQGRAAVERDIRRSVVPFDPEFFRAAKIRRRMEDVKTPDQLGAILKNLKGFTSWQVVPFSPDLHQSARGSRGRVRGQRKRITMDVRAWKKYVRRIQGHVGRMRAAWYPAYLHVGGDAPPGWVARHMSGARGSFIDGLGTHEKPYFEIANYARGIAPVMSRRVSEALRARSEAMVKDLALYHSGIKRKVGLE